ncbi:1248_t:CDS:2 [Dentiscutata erythropus]|uniref:1248_t:CDS:1 n=1 Tax=Dentiscutata erythropus TaxID=1348616 RepID=A0A9N9HCE8_9GLOM|nr:1248_t:CDS:2 [Dentiscutata erythropus]
MESIFQYQSESSDTETYEIEDESVQSVTAKVEPTFTQKPKRKASTSETVCLASECSTSTPYFTVDKNRRAKDKTFKEIKGTASEVSESQLSITKLLSLPSRIRSALDNEHESINIVRSNSIPRRQIASLPKEHTKGVNSLLWCGSFGQVLASASMDCTVRIWDIFRSRKCVRVIKHDGAVKDIRWNISFNNILSGGYDKVAKLSDIETGSTIQTFPHPQIVTTLRYHPTQPNIFVSGMIQDGIRSWDLRTNKVIKESRKFMGSVNDIEFFPNGNNILTCSDYVVRNASDKNIMVWEIDSMTTISNQIYQEAFSCTALRFHPFRKHFVAQSNGNYIAIFGGEKPWKLDKRKRFEGHLVNGHPIRCNFSPEPDQGRFLASGDANGSIFFYEWPTSKIVKTIEGAHLGACIDVCWHPLLNGVVASCGWDGKVALWGVNTFSL